jgi:hypothetical protein
MKLHRFANGIISKRRNSGNWLIVFGSWVDCRVSLSDFAGMAFATLIEPDRAAALAATADAGDAG